MNTDIWNEIHAERVRAHKLHDENSMEKLPIDNMIRLSILVEEVGEVAKVFNEGALNPDIGIDFVALRKELIQVSAMSGAWADKLGEHID